jgi:Transposase IS66 family
MAMLAPVHVENFGRLFGSNQPISAHFTAFNSSDQLQRRRSSMFQEALLKIKGIEPTNNAAERVLRQSVIQRKISHCDQSRQGAFCLSRLLTVTASLQKHGRDIWDFLEHAWITHHRRAVMPSLLLDP